MLARSVAGHSQAQFDLLSGVAVRPRARALADGALASGQLLPQLRHIRMLCKPQRPFGQSPLIFRKAHPSRVARIDQRVLEHRVESLQPGQQEFEGRSVRGVARRTVAARSASASEDKRNKAPSCPTVNSASRRLPSSSSAYISHPPTPQHVANGTPNVTRIAGGNRRRRAPP
jgi:hypothetical protein